MRDDSRAKAISGFVNPARKPLLTATISAVASTIRSRWLLTTLLARQVVAAARQAHGSSGALAAHLRNRQLVRRAPAHAAVRRARAAATAGRQAPDAQLKCSGQLRAARAARPRASGASPRPRGCRRSGTSPSDLARLLTPRVLAPGADPSALEHHRRAVAPFQRPRSRAEGAEQRERHRLGLHRRPARRTR